MWERPPAPSQSLTCFSEVPDQPIPGPGHAERWEQAADHRVWHMPCWLPWLAALCLGLPCLQGAREPLHRAWGC